MFIFSILLSVHLLWCWQGEFVKQSRVPLVADHFLYSHDINVWFSGDIVRNNIALRLFSDTSQMTWKCSKEKKLENEAQASESLMFSRRHITYQPWVKKKKSARSMNFETAFVVIRCLPFPHLPTKPPTHRSIPPDRGSRNKIKNLIFVPRSPDDVYPPLREEEQDDYLLNSLDMDLSSTSIIPPVSHVAKSRE